MEHKLKDRYRRYESLILGEGMSSIPEIARNVGLREPLVLNDLLRMSVKGLLPGRFADADTMTVVRLDDIYDKRPNLNPNIDLDDLSVTLTQAVNAAAPIFSPSPVKNELQPLVVECPGCGSPLTYAQGSKTG